MTERDFSGRVALITGGASGIGAATARQLAARGASVVIADLHEERAREVAEEISGTGGRAVAKATDVAVPAQVSAAVDFAVDTYGGLHYALNNVAVLQKTAAPIGEVDVDDWRRVIDGSLNGVFYGLRFQLPAIVASGGGSIVNISSIAGIWGTYNNAGYVTSKHAILGLTKAAALEYASQGVRVNAVCPGYVDTPMSRTIPEEKMRRLAARHPVGRLGLPEEIANHVVYLMSDAASFVTGSTNVVDGGFTAGYLGAMSE